MTNLSAIIAPTNVVTTTGTQTLSNKTLVAPALGTPASGDLSNCTNIPAGSAATPTALGTVYGKQTTVGGTPYLTAIGYNAAGGTTGVGVTAVGVGALYTNGAGARSTAMGYNAGYSNTGDNNLFIGNQTGFTNTTGTGNSFVSGMDSNNWPAGYYNTTGANNSAFGGGALRANTTGSSNTAVGTDALHLNTTASNNTAVGYESLKANTTGAEDVAVGMQALFVNTTGYSNTAVGYQAAYTSTTGFETTAIGYRALYNQTTGNSNTAVGLETSSGITTGTLNTGFGQQAGRNVTTGVGNTSIGYRAGQSITTATTTTCIGYFAAAGAVTGNGILHITSGSGSTASSSSAYNEMVICCDGTTGKGSVTGFINPQGGGVYQGNNSATWSVTSDQRLKKNIVDNNTGLEKITQIQVRNFEYRLPEEVTELPQDQAIQKTGVQLGAIAQELQAVLPDCVKTESTGVLSVDSDNLTWYMINAIKELKAEVDSLKSQLQGN